MVLVAPVLVGASPAWSQAAKSAEDTSSVIIRTTYYDDLPGAKHLTFSDPTEATQDTILSDLSDAPAVQAAKPIVPAQAPLEPIPAGAAASAAPAATVPASQTPPQSPFDGPTSSQNATFASKAAVTLGELSSCCDACDCWPGCDDCPSSSLTVFAGVESWRGVSEVDWPNNNGASFGFNYGTSFGMLKDAGIGFQVGGSYGIYDWSGRGSVADQTNAQQQIFITTGFFTKADADFRWSAGIVYDFMINNNFGAAASDGTLGQWRGQIGYALSTHNEVGLWGAARDRSLNQADLTYRGVDQLNLFWHHKFEQGADSSVWVGVPDHTKLGGTGSLGDFIAGCTFNVPISDYAALYSNAQYMHPSSRPGELGSSEDTWNVGFGIAFYVGGNARTRTVAGSCWSPLMNVANNGTFMVDSNVNTLP